MKLTNETQGPKIINTTEGPVTLAPGESRDDLDVSDAEMAAMDRVGFLKAPAGTAPAGAPQPMGTGDQPGEGTPEQQVQKLVDDNSKDQLLEIAETEGVEGVTADSNKTDIATAIVTARNAE